MFFRSKKIIIIIASLNILKYNRRILQSFNEEFNMKKLVICAIIMTLSAHCSAAYKDCQLAQDKLVDEYNKKFWLVDKIPTALGTMLGWAIGTLAVFALPAEIPFTAPAAVAATSAGGILGDHIGDQLKEQRENFIRKNIKNSKEIKLNHLCR